MSQFSKDVQELVKNLNEGLALAGVDGVSQQITAAAIGNESYNPSDAVLAGMENLDNMIDTIITSNESFANGFTEAGRVAAADISNYAVGAESPAIPITNTPPPNSRVITPEQLNVTDVAVSNESFDGVSANNVFTMSVATALYGSRQDEFGDSFFKPVTVSASDAGISIPINIPLMVSDTLRGVNGVVGKTKGIEILKNLHNSDVFGGKKNRLVPVKTVDTEEFFVPGSSVGFTSGNEELVTGSIKFGVDIDIIRLGRTPAMLAKGIVDDHATLSPAVTINDILVSLTGKVGTTTVTETFSIPIDQLGGAGFTQTAAGSTNDIQLQFKSDYIILDTSNSRTSNGGVSAILSNLPPNHKVYMQVRLTGEGNVVTGVIRVDAVSSKIVKIVDASHNQLVPGSPDDVAIREVFSTFKPLGYTPEAYPTNSDGSDLGRIITMDTQSVVYMIPNRAPTSVVGPMNPGPGTGSIVDIALPQLIQNLVREMANTAVDELINIANRFNALHVQNSLGDLDLGMIGCAYVNPYFDGDILDVSGALNTIESATQAESIAEVIRNDMKNAILRAAADSGFAAVHSELNGISGGKIGVVIGTDPRIGDLVGRTFDMGPGFDVKVVTTNNPRVKGTYFATFTNHSDKSNTPNPLDFGFVAIRPTLTTDGPHNSGTANIRAITNQPSYIHVQTLPILIRRVIMNLDEAYGKIPQKVIQQQ